MSLVYHLVEHVRVVTSSGSALKRGLKWTNFNYWRFSLAFEYVNALNVENAKYWLTFSPLGFVFS